MTKDGLHKKEMKLLSCNNIVGEKISLFSKVMLSLTVRDWFSSRIFFPSIDLATFAFDSRRHQDYPFALSFYINGLISCRVSVCCEFKHKKNALLGGPTGSFAIQDVLHAKPCETFVQSHFFPMKKILKWFYSLKLSIWTDQKTKQKPIEKTATLSSSTTFRSTRTLWTISCA